MHFDKPSKNPHCKFYTTYLRRKCMAYSQKRTTKWMWKFNMFHCYLNFNVKCLHAEIFSRYSNSKSNRKPFIHILPCSHIERKLDNLLPCENFCKYHKCSRFIVIVTLSGKVQSTVGNCEFIVYFFWKIHKKTTILVVFSWNFCIFL